jgi:hypothetical protein
MIAAMKLLVAILPDFDIVGAKGEDYILKYNLAKSSLISIPKEVYDAFSDKYNRKIYNG